ncbi:MAG: arylsulfatase [Verrucomicrobiota bacterium]
MKVSLLFSVVFFSLVTLLKPVDARPPNVVIFLSDDQGWGDLSITGNTDMATPNIDRLATEGARFMNFYVSPVCSPTRAEFLTGRFHPRSNVYSTSEGGERMDVDEVTIADVFKEAGYATAAFGKWHNGMQYPYHPNARGFDEFYGFCSGHWGNYFDPMLEHNGKVVQGEGFCVDDFTNRAMEFIREHRNEPFFVYLPYNTPHSPMQVPDEYWDRFKDKDLKLQRRPDDHTRAALAMCENIDWNVGRVLDELDELGLAEDTIVIYFNDNGPNGPRWNDGLKGKKGAVDEGGVKSPLHVRYPAAIAPGTVVHSLSSAVDLLPTLTELTGLSFTSEKPLDGISKLPWLKDEDTPMTNRIVVSHWGKRQSARNQRFRLDQRGKLFDIEADPGQTKEVTNTYPEVAETLGRAIEDYRKNVLSELSPRKEDDRPFIVGHPDARYTHLPARDGEASGGIERSSKWANCSYFTNWKREGESISWKAEVPEDGRFKATLYYTCSEAGVGSEVTLESAGNRLDFVIDEPHDPPLLGAEDDRSPRKESYVKRFKEKEIGEIDLSAGPQVMRLVAEKVPNGEVMDFRLLVLERLQ